MECREYIEHIVDTKQNMDELSDMFCEMLDMLEDETREEMEERLYVLAYGEHLNEEMATKYVEVMRPYGEHWNMEQTTQVGNPYGWDKYSKCSFYWTMNMLYNDYHSILNDDTNMYVKMARSFLIDEDAPSGDEKAFRYIIAMK